MRSKSFWGLLTAVLLALAALAVVGQLRQNDSSAAWAMAVAMDQQLQDAAAQAYRAGHPDRAVPALEAYLAYLERAEPLVVPWQPGQNPWLDGRALAAERMLAAGRLASIADRTGDRERAADLWARALKHASATGRSDVSLASVREAVYRSAPGDGWVRPDEH